MNEKTRKPNAKHKKSKPILVVVREYSGKKTMTEAFEEVIEKQVNNRFDEWFDNKKIQ